MVEFRKIKKGLLFFIIISVLFFNFFLYVNTLPNNNNFNIEDVNRDDCSFSAFDIENYYNQSSVVLNIGFKEISIFPDISNIRCVGKVHSIPNVENFQSGNVYLIINTSSNLINVLNKIILSITLIFLFIFREYKIKYFLLFLLLLLFEIINTRYFFTSSNFFNYKYFVSSIIFASLIFSNSKYLKKYSENILLYIKKIEFNQDINTLRAFSVLAVVFYHFEIGGFNGGWLGVDIFFIISGFLISNRILNNILKDEFSFRVFYLKRIKRILPALYSTLIFTSFISYFVFSPKALIEYLNSAIASILIYSNYYFLNLDFYTAYSTKFQPLLHTWSLSIEEQFYLIFPIFLYLIIKHQRKQFFNYIVAFLLFSLYLNLESFSTNEIFYLLQFRIWQFLFGVIVMFIYCMDIKIDNKVFQYIGLALLIFSFLYFDNIYITNLLPKIIVSISFALIVLSDGSLNTKIFSSSLINKIGLSSYSIYLLHQPLLAMYKYIQRRQLFILNDSTVIVLLIFTLILGYANWRFVETKFLNTESPYKAVSIIFFGILIFSGIGLFTEGFSKRSEIKELPREVVYYSVNVNQYPLAKMKQEEMDYVCGHINLPYFDLNKNIIRYKCENGPFTYKYKNVDKEIFVMGDSHANMLSVSMIDELDNDYNLVPINGTLGRCLLSGQADSNDILYAWSNQFFNSFLEQLDSSKDVVVIVGRFDNWISEIGKFEFQSFEGDYLDELDSRIESLISKSKEVVLVYPVPSYPYDIAEQYVNGNINWPDTISIDQTKYFEHYQDTYNFLNKFESENLIRIYPEKIFCDTFLKNKCVASINNILYYSDSNHLTLNGSALVAEKVYTELISK